MSLATVLLIVLILVLLGGFRDWGPGPFYGTGNVGFVVLIVVLVLLFAGRIHGL